MNYRLKTEIRIGKNEYFWGGAVAHGVRMPLSADSEYEFDVNENETDNQVNTLFTSTCGRYVAIDGEFKLSAKNGVLTFYTNVKPYVGECEEKTLKAAYLAGVKLLRKEIPVNFSRNLLKKPQFCTWTEMGINVSEEKILRYAECIAGGNLAHDLLIIDDGWSVDYGDWRFHPDKIPHPKQMIEKLHKSGFRVSLWVVPFVNETAKDYEYLKNAGALVCGADGEVKKKTWWNGKSAVLDLTSETARNYFTGVLDSLMRDFGADGFKFDAGDEIYYHNDVTSRPVSPAEHCALYSEIAKRYEIAEVRSGFQNSGSHLITRLNDKRKSWEHENGIKTLVPNMIQAGLCAYPFSCADMIGGGMISDFGTEKCEKSGVAEGKICSEQEELAARFCECNALMPAMQFSCSYWKKNELLNTIYGGCVALHSAAGDYLDELIDEAIKTCAPILRCLEYEFPHQGYETTTDKFMLGEKYLVYPVVRPGVREAELCLPSGARWKYVPNGIIYEGGETVKVSAPVDTLPYFERVDEAARL